MIEGPTIQENKVLVNSNILHDLAKIAGQLRLLSDEVHKPRINRWMVLKTVGELFKIFDYLYEDIQKRNGLKKEGI